MAENNRKRALVNLSDKELHEKIEGKAKHVVYSYNDFYWEFQRRSQERHDKTIRRMTYVIAASAVVTTIAAILPSMCR